MREKKRQIYDLDVFLITTERFDKMKNIKAVLKLRAIEAIEENIRYTFTFQYKLRLLTVCL